MRRLAASTALALALFALPLQAEMTPDERQALQGEIRAYLLENPEVLVEAMNILQTREDTAALERDTAMVQSNADDLFASPGDWVGGNPDGDITLVEFMDYQCGYCRKAYSEVDELVTSDGNIRFVVKEFPILGEASLLSSQFAIAILQLHGNAAYEGAHDALIALRGEPNADTLARVATDLGLDPQAIADKMNSDEVMAVIRANHALAEKMEISGTPTFVLKNTMMRGYVPLDGMREIVAGTREEG